VPEDKKDQTEPVHKPNLAEIMRAEVDDFQQCYIFIWTPDPGRDIVKVSLDDGKIRLNLKRQKFLDLMLSIMNINQQPTDYHYFRIRESVNRYGGWFYYDREKDEFKELQERPDFQKITARQLYEKSREDLAGTSRDSDRFIGLAKFNETFKQTKSEVQPRSIRDRLFGARIFRNYDSKKKP